MNEPYTTMITDVSNVGFSLNQDQHHQSKGLINSHDPKANIPLGAAHTAAKQNNQESRGGENQ